MAQVDFSNARIEPANISPSVNPTAYSNLTLAGYNDTLYDSRINAVSSNINVTQLTNQQKQLMYLYQGTFSASGTEFYIIHAPSYTNYAGWKVSNISFSAGDTYVFQINATLVCN